MAYADPDKQREYQRNWKRNNKPLGKKVVTFEQLLKSLKWT